MCNKCNTIFFTAIIKFQNPHIMELIQDKNGCRLNLISGSMITGRNRLFEVRGAFIHCGRKFEYELDEIIAFEGWRNSCSKNPDLINQLRQSGKRNKIFVPAEVLHQQFNDGIMEHL